MPDLSSKPPTPVVLGTATPGGGFPLYGQSFADIINAAEPTLRVEPRNTKGSTENVPLLETGNLDIALVQGEVAHEALSGIGRPPADLRILCAMYSTAGMFVVRADSAVRCIDDLRGKRVAFGAKGSGLVILARNMLDGLGLDQNGDFEAVYLDRAGDGPAMVLDGQVAALWGGGVGWPGFTAVSQSEQGARFIAPGPDEIGRILARQAFLRPLTIPAGVYRRQHAPIPSVGSWSFVLARPSLDASVAFRLARALHTSEQKFGELLDQARETTAANTISATPSIDRLHLGVQLYFRESGLLT